MIFERLVVGPLQVNCYVLGCRASREAVVIDPGGNVSEIVAALRGHGLHVTQIVNTHAHFDHVLGVRELQEITGAPFLLHADEAPVLEALPRMAQAWLGYDPGPLPHIDRTIAAGDLIRFGQYALEVRATPGHSPGGISLVDHEGRRVFTGDALFAGSVGRTDLPGADANLLIRSIREQLMTLPEEYIVLPGHGPATTIAEEHRHNPFLQSETTAAWLS